MPCHRCRHRTHVWKVHHERSEEALAHARPHPASAAPSPATSNATTPVPRPSATPRRTATSATPPRRSSPAAPRWAWGSPVPSAPPSWSRAPGRPRPGGPGTTPATRATGARCLSLRSSRSTHPSTPSTCRRDTAGSRSSAGETRCSGLHRTLTSPGKPPGRRPASLATTTTTRRSFASPTARRACWSATTNTSIPRSCSRPPRHPLSKRPSAAPSSTTPWA